MYTNNFISQFQETPLQSNNEEQEEDTISLSDFPLCRNSSTNTRENRKPSPDSSDLFEFFNDLRSEMSHAEDIIFCGKPIFNDQIMSRRYCDSLPDTNPTKSNTRLTRSSRSLDCKKLRRNSSLVMKSEASDTHRSFVKSAVKFEGSKPKWYGLMKFQPEIDLRDMKSRQVRLNPAMIPASRGDRRSSWDFLNVLSCKTHASVVVSGPNNFVPQV